MSIPASRSRDLLVETMDRSSLRSATASVRPLKSTSIAGKSSFVNLSGLAAGTEPQPARFRRLPPQPESGVIRNADLGGVMFGERAGIVVGSDVPTIAAMKHRPLAS